MKEKWKLASCEVVGRSHIQKDLPCQDKTYKLVKKHSSGIFYGIALADGAGSCTHSDKGAEFITKEILYFIKSKFSYLYKNKGSDNKITSFIEKNLKQYAQNNKLSFKDLSSTLLFVTIKNGKYIAGHIGDGVIGVCGKKFLKTLSTPQNGEFSNSTFFTTSTNYPKRLRVYKGIVNSEETEGFILMSDGTAESLYDKKRGKLSESCCKIVSWLEKHKESEVEKALEKNLKDVISKKTVDDCSIAIMKKV